MKCFEYVETKLHDTYVRAMNLPMLHLIELNVRRYKVTTKKFLPFSHFIHPDCDGA